MTVQDAYHRLVERCGPKVKGNAAYHRVPKGWTEDDGDGGVWVCIGAWEDMIPMLARAVSNPGRCVMRKEDDE